MATPAYVRTHETTGAIHLRTDDGLAVVWLSPRGLHVVADGVPAGRVVPWAALLDIPAGYGVLCNGWHVGTYATEREAIDRVTDLRGVGDAADFFRIPA